MKRQRVWLWLLAVSLPLALYAAIVERASWRPRRYSVAQKSEQLFDLSWLPDGNRVRVLIGKTNTNQSRYEIWDLHRRQRLQQIPMGAFDATSILTFGNDVVCSDFSPEYGDRTEFRVHSLTKHTVRVLGQFEECWWAGDRLAGVKTQEYGSPPFCDFTFYDSTHFRRTGSIRITAPNNYSMSNYEGAASFCYGLSEHNGAIALINPAHPCNVVNGDGMRREVLLFDARSGKQGRILSAAKPNQEVTGLIWSPDERFLYVFISEYVPSRPGVFLMRCWDKKAAHWSSQTILEYQPATVGFSPDKTLMVISDGEKHCTLLDTATCRISRDILLPSSTAFNVDFDFSPDGRTLAVAQGTAVTLWRVR